MCSFLFTVSIMVFAYFICAVLLYGDVFRYVKVFLRYLRGFIRVFRGFYMDLTLVWEKRLQYNWKEWYTIGNKSAWREILTLQIHILSRKRLSMYRSAEHSLRFRFSAVHLLMTAFANSLRSNRATQPSLAQPKFRKPRWYSCYNT